MSTFSYTAIEASTGRERRGTVEGVNAAQATMLLKVRGLAPMSLEPAGVRRVVAAVRTESLAEAKRKPRGRAIVFGRVASVKALAVFTRQLSTLVGSGMPLLRGLEVLARQERNEAFRRAIEEIAETIRSGGTLSEGLRRYPKIFDKLYVNMVKAGETSGQLETVLDRLSRFMEKAERVKGKVKAAMTYPAIVMVLAVGIVAALMVFVVPRFEQIFAGMLNGQPLPALTRSVLAVSNAVQQHAVLSVLAVGAAIGVYVVFRRSPTGERTMDRLALVLPVLGDLVLKGAIARFTRTFGTLLSSGVPMLQALTITRETSGNVHVAAAIDEVHERVKAGESVARPLAATGIFPGMVASMIEVGEETGALPTMLGRIADTYDEEVDNAVTGLTSLVEPLMIVFLAGVVGTIVIALFLPIVSIIQHLQ